MHDLIATPDALIDATPAARQNLTARIDQTIAAWLDAAYNRTRSAETRRAYRSTIDAFRQALRTLRLDLADEPAGVALAAQGWAGQGVPAPSTFNRRLA